MFRNGPLANGWLSLLAVSGLFWPALGRACTYSQDAEPVGHASADYFAAQMAPQATYVDVAVAEASQTAIGSDEQSRLRSTSFRIVYRLKGRSADRFSLYVHELGTKDTITVARHFVDETGRIMPYPYPHEGTLGRAVPMNSCDPGVLGVRIGQAYVIFREADGRLLDRVPLHGNRSQRLFPIMPVSLDEDIGWLQAALVATVPQDMAHQTDDALGLRAVRFSRGLTHEEALRWLQQADVRPVAVFIGRGKLVEEFRLPVDQGSIELISHAFSSIAARPRRSQLNALARDLLDEDDERLSLDTSLQMRARLLIESLEAEPSSGTSGEVLAMEVTGTQGALSGLNSAPDVAELRSGFVFRDRVAAAPLVPGSAPAYPYQIEEWRETQKSLRRRLRAVADRRPVPKPQLAPAENEGPKTPAN